MTNLRINIISKKDKLFYKNCIEKFNKNYTKFLDPKEFYIVKSLLNKAKIKYNEFTPFDGSNSYILYKDIIPNVCLIKTKNNNYKHSDILGSFYSLGFDIHIIGDIILEDDYIYIVTLTEYCDLIIEQFVSIKNDYVIFEKCQYKSLSYKTEDIILNVSSLRLDLLISKLIKKSRSQVKELFNRKEILFNYDNPKQDITVNESDTFSVHKYGKYTIDNIVLNKNKYKIILKKYI